MSEKLKPIREQLARLEELADIFEKRMNFPLLVFMMIFGAALAASFFVLSFFYIH